MAEVDVVFRKLCKEIKEEGRLYNNVNRGVKRLQIPSFDFKHNMSEGFPAITNKQLPFKFVKGELIWFLRGDTNVKYLVDNGIPIWNKDAYNLYVKVASGNLGAEANNLYFNNGDGTFRMYSLKEFERLILETDSIDALRNYCSYEDYTIGDVGRNYSAQWRDFRGAAEGIDHDHKSFVYERHDQIEELIVGMRKDIMSSRLIVNAWNPSELDKTALPPCHDKFQIIGVPLSDKERIASTYSIRDWSNIVKLDSEKEAFEVTPEFGFELHWNQRSVDTFLGLPFNVASYGLMSIILGEITEFPSMGIEGSLKCVHFYDNQLEAVDTLLERPNVHQNCELELSEGFKGLCKLYRLGDISLSELFNLIEIDMFKLKGYESDEAINVEMLAPKSI